MHQIRIFPSLLSADFGKLQAEIDRAAPYVDGFHFDVMDGHFVPNLTMGAPVLKCLKSDKPFDAHLMVESPDHLLAAFAKAGASAISVHVENCPHIHRTFQLLHDLGVAAGIAINPGTSFETAIEAIEFADFVLVMSVNPGFSGQEFIPETLKKVRKIRERFPHVDIQIDGGINDKTIAQALAAGANWIVSGSYFWQAADQKKAAALLRGQAGK